MSKIHFLISVLTFLAVLAVLSLLVYVVRQDYVPQEVVGKEIAVVTPTMDLTPTVEPTATVSAKPTKKTFLTPAPTSDTME